MWRYNKVLVIDDNEPHRQQLKIILDFLGKETVVTDFGDWREAVRDDGGAEHYLAVVVGDCALGQEGLLPLLKGIHNWNDELPVILASDQLEINTAWVQSEHAAVIASLNMPLSYSTLLDTLHRTQLYREARIAKHRFLRRPVHLFRSLVGASREIQAVRDMIAQLADTDVEVLITGKSGTGKEVVARNLHYNSPRRHQPFISVNCGAIPAELLERELFGYEKGAFADARSARLGRFELAEGGMLFLSEIETMPLDMQDKLLLILQERCFESLGGKRAIRFDVRVIAATHRNLQEMIAEGSFREELYSRLSLFTINLPSLKERAEDIPLLINELVVRLESEQCASVRFNSAAIMSLCQHDWQGNTRELASLVERLAVTHPYGLVGVQDLPPNYRHVNEKESEGRSDSAASVDGVSFDSTRLLPEQGIDMRKYMADLERDLIQQALKACGGVVARAADKLSIRRTTLVEKMRKYDLQR